MNENIEVNAMFQNMDMGNMLGIITQLGIVMNILFLIFFLLQGWGLYNINKKLGESHPWLAFIPIIQIYSFVKAGGKSGIWILWIILGLIIFLIPGLILVLIVCSGIAKRTGRGFGSAILIFFFPYIILPIIGHKFQAKDNQTIEKEKQQQEDTNKNNSNKNKNIEL